MGRLPFEHAETNMKRYGKTLMHHVPESTTVLLKRLCTDYQPSRDSTDRDSLDRTALNKVGTLEFLLSIMGTLLFTGQQRLSEVMAPLWE